MRRLGLARGEARVVAKHLQCIAQVGPAGQQRAPATSQGQPHDEDESVQHDEIGTEPVRRRAAAIMPGTRIMWL
jgi:hypothetical protein